jgi:hypothetical protein
MRKKELAVIKALGENVERFAGKSVRAKVMAGSEKLDAKSGPAEIASWMKGAMKRLDKSVSKAKRADIRKACGRGCAEVNKGTIERARDKRRKFGTLEDYFAAELRKPLAGTGLVKQGNVLTWFFTPRSFNPPMRCYCGLMKGLPEDEEISKTYCLCSRGFVERYWESVLDKPVRVELLESCLTGAPECKFSIRF